MRSDNVDRFSAYRVVLWCMTEHDDFHKMADMLRGRLERLRAYRGQNPLETEAGRRLFGEKLHLQIAFFEAILADADVTRLPSF
jgi:hypothetical protein